MKVFGTMIVTVGNGKKCSTLDHFVEVEQVGFDNVEIKGKKESQRIPRILGSGWIHQVLQTIPVSSSILLSVFHSFSFPQQTPLWTSALMSSVLTVSIPTGFNKNSINFSAT